MKQFKDNKDRTWDIVVDVVNAKKCMDLLSVDILDLFSEQGRELLDKPAKLVDVLWLLCEKQAKERGVDDESFGRAMAGDAIVDGARALWDDYVNFSPSSKRPLLEKQMQKVKELEAKMMTKGMEALDSLDIESLLNAMKLPESSALIQATTPSEN